MVRRPRFDPLLGALACTIAVVAWTAGLYPWAPRDPLWLAPLNESVFWLAVLYPLFVAGSVLFDRAARLISRNGED